MGGTRPEGMPLAEHSNHKFYDKQGEFPGKEAVQARVEAFLTKLDTDGDGTLTMEEFIQLIPEREAENLAGKPKEEVVEMLMGFFGDGDCWDQAGPKLMAIEEHMALTPSPAVAPVCHRSTDASMEQALDQDATRVKSQWV